MIKSIATAHGDDGQPFPDERVLEIIARQTDTVLLSFSRGKDSIAAWLVLRRHFKRVIPYFQYHIPGLKFVDDSLAYFEDYFGTNIYRVPHPHFYDMLTERIFQPPDHINGLRLLHIPRRWSDDDCADAVKDMAGVSRYTWVAHGIRAFDNLTRRAWYKRHGPINWKRRTFAPVAAMNKARLIETIRGADVRLPVDYHLFGCSFDGLTYKFLGPLHDRYPDDYARIRDWFPLCDLELLRYWRMNREQAETD